MYFQCSIRIRMIILGQLYLIEETLKVHISIKILIKIKHKYVLTQKRCDTYNVERIYLKYMG